MKNLQHGQHIMKAIGVFVVLPLERSLFLETAQAVGQAIAQRGQTLVYGGGRSGLMGVIADSALQAGEQ